jgi:hypothetical protein
MSATRLLAWVFAGRRQIAYEQMRCAEEIAYAVLAAADDALVGVAVELYEDAATSLAEVEA